MVRDLRNDRGDRANLIDGQKVDFKKLQKLRNFQVESSEKLCITNQQIVGERPHLKSHQEPSRIRMHAHGVAKPNFNQSH